MILAGLFLSHQQRTDINVSHIPPQCLPSSSALRCKMVLLISFVISHIPMPVAETTVLKQV